MKKTDAQAGIRTSAQARLPANPQTRTTLRPTVHPGALERGPIRDAMPGLQRRIRTRDPPVGTSRLRFPPRPPYRDAQSDAADTGTRENAQREDRSLRRTIPAMSQTHRPAAENMEAHRAAKSRMAAGDRRRRRRTRRSGEAGPQVEIAAD